MLLPQGMKTAGMMAFWVAALLLAAMVTMASAQESVSVSSVNGVSETASSVNGVSKGSTQIASDLWTITPTAAECPLGTTFSVQAITGVTTISHIKNATADHMTVKVNVKADIPNFGGGIFTGTPTYAWVWSSNAYKDAYFTDAVWSPPGGFLVQLKDDTGQDFVRLRANLTMAIYPWEAQGFLVDGIQANSCSGAPGNCIGSACNAPDCSAAACTAPVSGST